MGENMKDDIELLNFIYQNSQMGVETLDQLIDMVDDNDFKRYLKEKYEGYLKIHKDAKSKLHELGYDEQGLTSFEKIRTYLMINMQTMTDKSVTHIAQMLMQGSTMGLIDAIRKLNDFPNTREDIRSLMNVLKEFEEKSYNDLKEFI